MIARIPCIAFGFLFLVLTVIAGCKLPSMVSAVATSSEVGVSSAACFLRVLSDFWVIRNPRF